MKMALRRAAAALRGFTRGFLGLAAAPPARDPGAVRRFLRDRASGHRTCC